MPPILLRPAIAVHIADSESETGEGSYRAPLYRTPARRGVVSTAGRSSNLVAMVKLPSNVHGDHWVRRGVALLCEKEMD